MPWKTYFTIEKHFLTIFLRKALVKTVLKRMLNLNNFHRNTFKFKQNDNLLSLTINS